MREAIVRGWMGPWYHLDEDKKVVFTHFMKSMRHVMSRLGAAVAKGTEVKYRNHVINRA